MELSEITIEHMLENIFTSYAVKKKRKDIVSYYKQLCVGDLFAGDTATGVTEEDVKRKVDEVLRVDRANIDSFLKYSKASSSYSKARRVGKDIKPVDDKPDSNYIGRAGECAVMSELLFRGYNVNSMMVDEGVDIVASKNNVFYYIQVKTKTIEEQNKFYFQIKQEAFNAFVGTQMRYILVARCRFSNEDRNIYFTFANGDIQRFLSVGAIPIPAESSNSLSIKIEYDTQKGKAYLYNNQFKEDVTFYMNRFEL